jgi:hypothetical protein
MDEGDPVLPRRGEWIGSFLRKIPKGFGPSAQRLPPRPQKPWRRRKSARLPWVDRVKTIHNLNEVAPTRLNRANSPRLLGLGTEAQPTSG